jgi:hypothetical protein
LSGANILAGRVVALVAKDREKLPAGMREYAFFDFFDPASPYADGDVMLGFASDRAGVTANALIEINGHRVLHKFLPCSLDMPRSEMRPSEYEIFIPSWKRDLRSSFKLPSLWDFHEGMYGGAEMNVLKSSLASPLKDESRRDSLSEEHPVHSTRCNAN